MLNITYNVALDVTVRNVKWHTKECERKFLAWSSLVEGDEQLDWPNHQTTLELCHACVA